MALLGDDAQIAKSVELPRKALVRVDAIRKACPTNQRATIESHKGAFSLISETVDIASGSAMGRS